LEKAGIVDDFITEKLNEIVLSVQGVLTFSDKLKQELVTPVDEEFILILPDKLFNEAMVGLKLPATIQMSMEIDDNVGAVRVMRAHIVDILLNLVANAIDAMPEGGQLSLSAHNSGNFVSLEVNDTGIGILSQHLSKIFDLSFSTKGSSGFGLWSARRNALRNQGDLRVESKPGNTTFTLLLPGTDRGAV
jgi:signal transduction histidine kinase